MIETRENIGDPAAFLNADPKLVTDKLPDDKMYFADGLIISGADIDMCVQSDTAVGGNCPPDSERPVSSFLGGLYVQGAKYWLMLNGRRFNVSYYPSPRAVNTLMEKLGIRPGEDAPRFVHASGRYNAKGDIPANLFVEHFMRQEYPQSTIKSNFDHDRGDDHGIGAILMPPQITAKLPEVAASGLHEKPIDPSWHTHPPGLPVARVAGDLDLLTVSIGHLAEELSSKHLVDIKQFTKGMLHGLSVTLMDDQYQNSEYLQRLWGVDRSYMSARYRFVEYAGNLIKERLLELRPAVETAQAELADAA